jgi:hypothetical protein
MSRLFDGYSTTISFNLAPAVQLWEIEITPPGLDGGGMIDQTNMRNIDFRTRVPKALITLTEMTGVFAYDPIVYNTIKNLLLNVNGAIFVHFPDGQSLQFFGWLNEFKPNRNTEGERPTANATIIPSNLDLGGNEFVPILA